MAIKKPLVLGTDGLIQQLQSGDSIAAPTNTPSLISVTNGESSAALVIGTPVYSSAAGTVKRAQANASATARVVGLCYDTSISAAAAGSIAVGDVITATTGQWDTITGGTGGLTFSAIYFLDAATPGKLTTTAPSTIGQYVTKVGVAISTTDLIFDPEEPILL